MNGVDDDVMMMAIITANLFDCYYNFSEKKIILESCYVYLCRIRQIYSIDEKIAYFKKNSINNKMLNATQQLGQYLRYIVNTN